MKGPVKFYMTEDALGKFLQTMNRPKIMKVEDRMKEKKEVSNKKAKEKKE